MLLDVGVPGILSPLVRLICHSCITILSRIICAICDCSWPEWAIFEACATSNRSVSNGSAIEYTWLMTFPISGGSGLLKVAIPAGRNICASYGSII